MGIAWYEIHKPQQEILAGSKGEDMSVTAALDTATITNDPLASVRNRLF